MWRKYKVIGSVIGATGLVLAIAGFFCVHSDWFLLWTIREYHPSLAKLSISIGANPNARYHNDRTALMEAASFEEPDVMEALLAHGADIDATDQAGWQAIHVAAADPDDMGRGVRLLLRHGANPEATTKDGVTPLMLAMDEEGEPPGIDALEANALELIAHSNDVNHRDSKGNTALLIATEASSPAVVRSLLRAGADPNEANNKGELPLERVSLDVPRLTLLLNYGADPFIRCGNRPAPYDAIGKNFGVELLLHQPDAEAMVQLMRKRRVDLGKPLPGRCHLDAVQTTASP